MSCVVLSCLSPVGSGTRIALGVLVNLWDEVLAKVEAKVNRHSFATWFRPTNFLSLQDGTARASACPTRSSRTGSPRTTRA